MPISAPPKTSYPPTKDGALWAAARAGKEAEVRALLDQGASASGHSDATSGATALHECLLHGMSKMARLLLEHGASASARDRRGNTPLHACAAASVTAGAAAVAEVLLGDGHKVDATAANDAGVTPLHLAAHHGKLDLVRLLVKHGAELNALDRQSRDPLAYAKDAKTEKLLLELVSREMIEEPEAGGGAVKTKAKAAPWQERFAAAQSGRKTVSGKVVSAAGTFSAAAPPKAKAAAAAAPKASGLKPPPKTTEPPAALAAAPAAKKKAAAPLPNAAKQKEIAPPPPLSSQSRIAQAFHAADADGSGSVSKRELYGTRLGHSAQHGPRLLLTSLLPLQVRRVEDGGDRSEEFRRRAEAVPCRRPRRCAPRRAILPHAAQFRRNSGAILRNSLTASPSPQVTAASPSLSSKSWRTS